MNIQIHIERLILDGLPLERRQGPLVRAAIEAELLRLLTVHGLAPELRAGGAMPSVRARTIQHSSASEPTLLGREIASAVFGGIGARGVRNANETKAITPGPQK
jgi:hypothetical protein